MVALVTRYDMTEMLSKEDFTIVKNPGMENMKIITLLQTGRVIFRQVLYRDCRLIPSS